MSSDASKPLQRLSALGQSVWVDFLSRESIRGGPPAAAAGRVLGRRRDIEPDDLPEGDDRGKRIRRAAAGARRGGLQPGRRRFWALAERDIQDACDLFRPVWERAAGRDGYVSLEVDPRPGLRHARTYRRRCACTRASTAPT